MHFFAAVNLAWLLPICGLIVAMYILKLRRRDVLVSSTYLWLQVIRDVQANAPFQKLRKNLLLILQLFAACLLIFALSRPFARTMGIGGRSMVLIVDTSASMGATDVRPNRLAQACDIARKIVADMKPGDQMIVLSAAVRPVALTGFTADHRELNVAIDRLAIHQTGTRMRDAVSLAAALVAARDASHIDIISDGGFEPISGVPLGKTHVSFHPVGIGSDNVGITAVDCRRGLTGATGLQALVVVRNYSAKARTVTVELMSGTELLDAQEVILAPRVEEVETFDLADPPEPRALDVRLDVRDSLAVDNQASLVIVPRTPIRVLLVTKGNPFLENALKVDQNIEVFRSAPGLAADPAKYDVAIYDGEAPAHLPEGRYLFARCTSDMCPATSGKEVSGQSVIDVRRDHPIVRYVDFGKTRWVSMWPGTSAPWAQEIASAGAGAAVVAGERGRTRAVWTAFGLDGQSGVFPYTVGYPIFVSSAVRWLAGVDDADALQMHTGTALAIRVPPGSGKLTIRRPDGRTSSVTADSDGMVHIDDPDVAGVYMVSGGGVRRMVAANLADDVESNITPRKDPEIGADPPGSSGRRVAVVHELWPWLVAGVLVLLCVEWWAFHRRVTV